MSENKTGFPSIDKPWLKYYSQEAIQVNLPECTMYDLVYEYNKNHLDENAIEYYGKRYTYREVLANADKVASAFQNYGVMENEIVVGCLLTIPETIFSVYGLNKAGITIDMIDPRNSIETIRDTIIGDHARVIITLDALVPRMLEAIGKEHISIISIPVTNSMPLLTKIIAKMSIKTPKVVDERVMDWNEFVKKFDDGNVRAFKYKMDHCCLIEHTGGTTGMPKSVMLSDYNLNSIASQAKYAPVNLKRGDSLMNVMPPFIAYGMTLGIHMPLCCGWTTVLIPKFEESKFADLILKHKPNCTMGVPAYYQTLMMSEKLNNKDLSFLKIALVGGDKIITDFEIAINKFFEKHNCHIKLTKGYSMTEASSSATITYEDCNKIGSCGVPLPHITIAAFEENTENELAYGEIGQLRMNTPSMMLGYKNNEAETEKICITDSNGKTWIHTGDLGYVDDDGCIFIVGREKRIIIRPDGFKLFPALIEHVVEQVPFVRESCCIGQRDESYLQGMKAVVFVTLKEPMDATVAENIIREQCENGLPEYEQPEKIVIIDKMPLTSIGKIDYRKLEGM